VSESIVAVLSSTLLFAFIICCVVSAALQILAWSRHTREGTPISLQALWRPEGRFDEIGMRQMQLARKLLVVGAMAYVAFGALTVIGIVV
jgi:hypothetical protein